MSVSLDAAGIRALLHELDERLRRNRVRGTVMLVGGAAVALREPSADRRTLDVDVAVSSGDVLATARAMAHSHPGLPETWLSDRVTMFMPPLDPSMLDVPAEPGLRVVESSDELLFAMKVIAQRSRDLPDLRLLAHRLGLIPVTADEVERLVRRTYHDPGQLEMLVGPGPDELRRMCESAARAIGMPQ